MGQQVSLNFTPNPTQAGFIYSKATADLWACRMGEGKSTGLVWSCFHHTMLNPGARWAFIRDTWENLKLSTFKEFMFWFEPFGVWRAGDKTFTWTAKIPGRRLEGEVIFMGLDDEKDAAKLQSVALAGFAMDEPAPAASSGGINEFIFSTAITRLRQPGMKWYAAKLAENNPDENHWTYKRFVNPGTEGFAYWQSRAPENEKNLPPNYYKGIRQAYEGRPDLVSRFVEGKFGFQKIGKEVTPEFAENLHVMPTLEPIAGKTLEILWDGGLNPTCIITQPTPMGNWLILDSFVGDGIGMEELIIDIVKPHILRKYNQWFRRNQKGQRMWRHIGDPALNNREQSSSLNSAAGVIRRTLGGVFLKGPVDIASRVDPLRAVLRKTRNGQGLVLIDRENAKEVWHALRGGWHYHVHTTGVIGEIVKDMHSHPGDALGYGAAILFPLQSIRGKSKTDGERQEARFFGGPRSGGFTQPGVKVPKDAALKMKWLG